MKPFLYTQPCVSDHVRKTNRLFEPVDPRPSDIRVYGSGSSRPITRRTCIRHRTYSTEVTSFLSNLPLHRIIRPCFSHSRLINIPIYAPYVKHFFRRFCRNFSCIFVSDVQGIRTCREARLIDSILCSIRLLVAPRGNFLCEQKVTKESFRRRGLRFPRLLKTSTLEPPKRNRARFPFDALRGRARFRLTSAVFDALLIFAEGMLPLGSPYGRAVTEGD